MSNFGDYARYYDLLYKDKNYEAEADYVNGVLEGAWGQGRRRAQPLSLLDLGCGTGRHAEVLARRGYDVLGVDRSTNMLEAARKRVTASDRLEFAHGDVRSLDLGRRFDCVVSLFHVLSYQTSNEDATGMLRTAASHLAPDGLFLCDFWYGPAVLTERPSVRVKRFESEEAEVIRIAEPRMDSGEDVVTVSYSILIRERSSDRVQQLSEEHRMRYFFLPEIDLLLDGAGLRRIVAQEWLSGRALGFDTWNAVVVARR